jgi:hypothetical protein
MLVGIASALFTVLAELAVTHWCDALADAGAERDEALRRSGTMRRRERRATGRIRTDDRSITNRELYP